MYTPIILHSSIYPFTQCLSLLVTSNPVNSAQDPKIPVIPKSDQAVNKDERKKILCRFYKNGRCKKGFECKFGHPKICNKFRQFGVILSNGKSKSSL